MCDLLQCVTVVMLGADCVTACEEQKYILWEMFKQLVYHRLVRRQRLVVFDAPLLFETHLLEHFVYPTVVVSCSEQHELARLKKRDGISQQDAEKRIASQMKLEVRVCGSVLMLLIFDMLWWPEVQ